MINNNLIIINNTTFILPETVPIVSYAIPNVLQNNQSLRRKGYTVEGLLITIPDVYYWVTGIPILSLNSHYQMEIPGTSHDKTLNTPSFIEISKDDPYPSGLLSSPDTENHVNYTKYKMLKHIYSILGTATEINGRILKGLLKALEKAFQKSPKTIVLLSFPPELRFVAEFVLFHLRDYSSLYGVKSKSPKIMELSTVEVNDAQGRKIMAMHTEDIAISYTKSSKKAYISHVNTTAHANDSRQGFTRTNQLLRHMRVNDSDFIFDLSNADYKHQTHTIKTPSDIEQLMSEAIYKEFREVEKDFVQVCLKIISATN